MFSELLKNLRAEADLSQKKLAEIIGVSPGNVSDWESGKAKPGYNALAALADCFEVSADYLLELEPEKSGSTDGIQRLEEIKREQRLVCDSSPLDAEEADLVAIYRLLPSHEQEDVFDLVHYKYKKYVEKKVESIYWTYKADKLKRKATDADSDLSGSGQGGIA